MYYHGVYESPFLCFRLTHRKIIQTFTTTWSDCFTLWHPLYQLEVSPLPLSDAVPNFVQLRVSF